MHAMLWVFGGIGGKLVRVLWVMGRCGWRSEAEREWSTGEVVRWPASVNICLWGEVKSEGWDGWTCCYCRASELAASVDVQIGEEPHEATCVKACLASFDMQLKFTSNAPKPYIEHRSQLWRSHSDHG